MSLRFIKMISCLLFSRIDLAGLAAEYSIFKDNAIKLLDEYCAINDKNVPWEEWREKVVNTIELFLRESIELTSDYFDSQGRSIFHERARENLRRIVIDDRE